LKQRHVRGPDDHDPVILNIKAQIPPPQLQGIGALALAFNQVESTIDRLFFVITDLPEELQLEVSTRMGGSEALLDVIELGAKPFLTAREMRRLEDALRDKGFGKLRDCRNGIIHIRHIDLATGVGVEVAKKGNIWDRLVNIEVLEKAYNLLVALNHELIAVLFLIVTVKKINALADDPTNKSRLEAVAATYRARFQESRSARLALPKLPKFPSESELKTAKAQYDLEFLNMISHAMRQWDVPQRPMQMSAALRASLEQQGMPVPLIRQALNPEGKK
jgi:hypothetical protein